MLPKQIQARAGSRKHARMLRGLYDTGAEKGLIRTTAASRFPLIELGDPVTVVGIGEGRARAGGVAHFQIKVLGKWCRYSAFAVPDDTIDVDLLIGEDFLFEYGLRVSVKRNRVEMENAYQFRRMTRRELFIASPRGRG
jgi:hypothetical protein